MPPDDLDAEATRAALQHLAGAGVDLARPLAMDFFIVAPSEAVGHVVVVRTVGMGFRSRLDRDEASGEWLCTCRVTLVPTVERVVALERLLGRLAQELGGVADGFDVAEEDEGIR
jgi:hypothetical protein